MTPNKSLHRPTGARHGFCITGNSRARRAVARELERCMSFRVLPTVTVLLLCTACTPDRDSASNPLIGEWQSDEALTLASMRSDKDVTPTARRLFEDDVFGHLHIEYRADTVRYWLDNKDFDTGFQPYKIAEISESQVVTEEWNEQSGKREKQTAYFFEDCFYVFTSKFNFKEFFCKVDSDN
jgi:hypothetical protein